MTVTAGAGETDWLSIGLGDYSGGLFETGVLNYNGRTGTQIAVTPGVGCRAWYDSNSAQCAKPGADDIVVNSGDKNDRLYSNEDHTTVNAGSGDDWIDAQGNSPDYQTWNGDSGFDTVHYIGGNIASVDGVRNDGYLGHENVATDVERLVGDMYSDTFTGASATRTTLMGMAGNDQLTAGAAGAEFFGGRGNDTMTGAGGDDTFTDMVGTDTMIGGSGDDTFHADDGDDADHITCGPGYDVVFADSAAEITDWGTPGPGPDGANSSCEVVLLG